MKIEKNLKKETLYLYLIQISNFILPLIAFPYLANKLGVVGFGKLGFAQAVFFLLNFIIDFGFILSGAKSVSNHLGNWNALSKIYTNIQIVKFVIFVSCLIIIFPLVNLMDLDKFDSTIIILTVLASFGAVLTPSYLFNGMSKNSVLALISIVVRSVFILPVFFIVNNPDDTIIAIILQIFPNVIIGGIIQFLIIKRKYVEFNLSYFDLAVLWKETKASYENFIASFFTLGFTYLTPLFVKFTLGDVALGLYTLVDRLIAAFRQIYVPINQAFFSRVCISFEKKEFDMYVFILKKTSIIFLTFGLIAILVHTFVGEWLIEKFFGAGFDIYGFLFIAIFTQIIVSFASILVNFVIIPSNTSYLLKRIYLIGLVVYIPMCVFLIKLFDLIGVFFAMLIVETLILSLLLYCSYFSVYKKF